MEVEVEEEDGVEISPNTVTPSFTARIAGARMKIPGKLVEGEEEEGDGVEGVEAGDEEG